MKTVAVALNAMATRFEIVLHGENPVALRAAGEEALAEIARLEDQLSLYKPNSEIARLNARAAHRPVRITPALFALLRHAQRLSEESGGAFDITIAPLVRCWGFMGGMGKMPMEEEIAEARARVGMRLIRLDAGDSTVQFARQGVMLDLGAVGKGYAVERAAEVLREAGITSAIIHGGTSTVYALGQPPDAETWKVAVGKPNDSAARQSHNQRSAEFIPLEHPSDEPAPKRNKFRAPGKSSPDVTLLRDSAARASLLATVPLRDEAMSVSAVWGRSFEAGGKTFGHVLDPRTGRPVTGALLAAVVLPSATETDALSTALLTLGRAGHERIARLRPAMRTLLMLESEAGSPIRIEAKGIAVPSLS